VRRNDFFFAVLLGLPVLTIGVAAVPHSGPAVRVAAVAHVHGAPAGPSADPSGDPSSDPSAFPSGGPSGAPTGDPSSGPSGDPSAQVTPSTSAPPPAAVPTGPSPADFIDIRQVPPKQAGARPGRRASRGSLVSRCGRNQNGHRNPDNFIVAPGVSNGAHHTHDYVGNLSTDGFSTDQSLQQAGTTCGGGDKSAYFWPVLRVTTPGDTSGQDGNNGTILQPSSVTLRFRGNPVSKVKAMPQFLRVITGDAKSATNGGANARAQWTCTGFSNRVTTKYPVCPRGSRVERILDFASCWDGKNIDSANHRTHVVFPDPATGASAAGLTPVPQLHMVLTYNVRQAQSRAIALDSFPEQLHNPVTDHADFENVMSNRLMSRVASCINRGRRC
jgi:hypothetical protein